MADFLDEKIIYNRKNMEEKNITLSDGVYVDGTLLQFIRIPILEKKLSIVLPDTFIDMPKDMAGIKYPHHNRPQIIKTSLDTKINYCFSYFPKQKILPEQVQPVTEKLQLMAKQADHSPQFTEAEALESSYFPTSWYGFTSLALDLQLYNIVFLCSVDQALLQGLFSCPYDAMEDWQVIALLMIKALGEYTQEEVDL